MNMKYCENCGCKIFNGKCVNCHDELFILDQYYELEMKLPDKNSNFMKKVKEHEKEINNKNDIYR